MRPAARGAAVLFVGLMLAACGDLAPAATPGATIRTGPQQTGTAPAGSNGAASSAGPGASHGGAPGPTGGGLPLPSQGGSGEPDMGSGRAVTVSLAVTGTTTGANGAYNDAGAARACGNAVLNLTGNTRAFNLYFPSDGAVRVTDVTFDADDLLAGATTTSFYLSVTVVTATGQGPPAVVIDTRAGNGDSGIAVLTSQAGATTLSATGTNRFGEGITLTASCAARA